MIQNEIFKKIGIDVSRETFSKLNIYIELLNKWQKAINLVSKSTLENVWIRHVADSAQINEFIEGKKVADLGSGAGFPGMVLAMINPSIEMSLVESDIRKCEFLREVKRKCQIDVDIINERIENIKDKKFDYIVSRALAPVNKLISLSENIKTENTKFIFLKGEKLEEELLEAEQFFSLKYEIFNSKTDNTGRILRIQEVK